MDFPDDAVEFGRCWSSTAGELYGVKTAISEVEKRAAEAFIRRQDAVANALRDLAVALGQTRDQLSKRLGEYIEEDRRRNYEKRKAL